MICMSMVWRRRSSYLGVSFLAGMTIYTLDERRWYGVVRRSLRAAGVGLYTIGNYKFLWTPDNASEVHARVARAMTTCCLENEGLYVKIGQALCSMAAVLPKEYVDNLNRLSDKAKTYDYHIIESIINAEIGEGVLGEIDPVAVGSASLAQVHKARYIPTGELVAVKVQKPNVSFQAGWDLRMYKWIVALLEWSFDIPLSWSVDFTCAHFLAELDFRKEGENSELARVQLSEKFKNTVYVPRVLATTPKVLITEWIDDTVQISDVKKLHERGFDCKKIVLESAKIFGYQVFNTGHVHCDPHPGNLLIRRMPGGGKYDHQIVLIDHGLYVDLPEKLRRDYARLWVAMSPPIDQDTVAEVCESWGIGSPQLFQSIVKASHEFGTKKNVELEDTQKKKKSAAERSAQIKQHLKQLLQDTSKFPKELILVGRCMNYIRAANWTHGSPIDRVAILANSARESLEGDNRASISKNWLLSVATSVLSLWPTSAAYHKDVVVR